MSTKGKTGYQSFTVWKNGHIYMSPKSQGFLILNSGSHCRLKLHRVLLCARHCTKDFKLLVLKHSCEVDALLQSCSTSKETKAQNKQFSESPQCFQKAELGFESRSPDSMPTLAELPLTSTREILTEAPQLCTEKHLPYSWRRWLEMSKWLFLT